jgi:hypothetical protein
MAYLPSANLQKLIYTTEVLAGQIVRLISRYLSDRNYDKPGWLETGRLRQRINRVLLFVSPEYHLICSRRWCAFTSVLFM